MKAIIAGESDYCECIDSAVVRLHERALCDNHRNQCEAGEARIT